MFIDHREHNGGESGSRGVEITVSSEVNITVLAQLSARRNRSICTKIKCLEVRSRGCDSENLIGLMPRERQTSNSKLTTWPTGQVFDDPGIVWRGRPADCTF